MYLNIHTHHIEADDAIIQVENLIIDSSIPMEVWIKQIGNSLPNQYFSAGLHPWYLKEGQLEADLALLKRILAHPKVLFVGECGLDKICQTDWTFQINVFKTQIQIAEELQKPIVIHCVRAFSEIIQIKKLLRPKLPWLIHGFNNNEQILRQLIQHQLYISLGSALLQDKSNAVRLITSIPIKQLFLETDDKNCTISSIFVAASKQLEVEVEYLQEKIYANFKQIV